MSNKTSLIITSTDTSGKTSNKTLTDINPATSSASLKSFAQGLIGLTDNTYDGSAVVERTEIIDDADKPLAHVEFTINGRTYTEADAVLTSSQYVLTLTFNASDTQYVKTNNDGHKEVHFLINEIETFALGEVCLTTAMLAQGYPRVSFGTDLPNRVVSGGCWGVYRSYDGLFACVEFFDEGTAINDNAIIAIGGTKARRGWKINIKLNRAG